MKDKEYKEIVMKAVEESNRDMKLMVARYEASKARDVKLKKVIADNKERWTQTLVYLSDDRFPDQWKVAEAHLDLILDDLIDKMKSVSKEYDK